MALRDKFRTSLIGSCLATMMLGGICMTSATAQELKIATAYKLMTLDPQYADLNENISLLSNIYERLVDQNEKMKEQPGLAASWKKLSPTQWEFTLRDNVKFHDGTPFTAEDVIYSIKRVQNLTESPSGGFQAYTKTIKSVTAPGPLTVIFETNENTPTLPLSLSSIFIMKHDDQGFKTTDELNTASLPVGTGPYKFDGWQSGETLQLIRNDDYWGGRPSWEKIDFRVVESPAARVAALTTGDVDIADFIPARDVETLKKRGIKIESTSAARSNFLQFDLTRDTLPGVTDKAGRPIPNPFRDVRVRQALTMATDRPFIVEKILLGYGTAAAQAFPTGMPGTSPNLTASGPDYEDAKALLAEAGYKEGFNLVLAGPAGRYPGDADSLQSVAQNWARIGVRAQPVVAPFSVFATKRATGEYPVWYAGCSGDAVTVCLDAVLASQNEETQKGSLNYGGYHNAAFDEALVKAGSLEPGKDRDEALARATELVMSDYPIIPLYHYHVIVGYGPHVASYSVHPRAYTTGMQAVPSGE